MTTPPDFRYSPEEKGLSPARIRLRLGYFPRKSSFLEIKRGKGGILVASILAYFCGEFTNSFILAKMKIRTQGRHLWARTIGSTLVGQAVDSVVFTVVACAFGVFPWSIALSIIAANYIFKVGIEVIFTPTPVLWNTPVIRLAQIRIAAIAAIWRAASTTAMRIP